jgi:hypothetical protein
MYMYSVLISIFSTQIYEVHVKVGEKRDKLYSELYRLSNFPCSLNFSKISIRISKKFKCRVLFLATSIYFV